MLDHKIPTRVGHGDVLRALAPLMELLGTNSDSVYSSLPVVIDLAGSTSEAGGSISFAVAPGSLDENKGLRAQAIPLVGHPQGLDFAEAAAMVRVQVGGVPE